MCTRVSVLLLATFLVQTNLRAILADGPPTANWPQGLPVYEHVVIVVEENKDYGDIIGNCNAPYINQLRQDGANLTQMYAEEHYSQGNYFWLFCGSNLGVGFDDKIPTRPFHDSNLGQQLIDHNKSFKGYSEDLPSIGSGVDAVQKNGEQIYGRKHVPWVSFANLPQGPTADRSCNLTWTDFPKAYNQLPTVSFVIPNLLNDMHNGGFVSSIRRGDDWLKNKIDPYYQWAKTHNSLLIVTFDECNDVTDITGLTDPAAMPTTDMGRVVQNRIATIFAGDHIQRGDYAEGKGVTHVNVLRTLEAMYGLPKAGAQQVNAVTAGITDNYVITDVFKIGH
jgi:phosphatidylinositol-3-phosphatase